MTLPIRKPFPRAPRGSPELTVPCSMAVATTTGGRYFLRVAGQSKPGFGNDVTRLATERRALAAVLGGIMSLLSDNLPRIRDSWAIERGRYSRTGPMNQGLLSTTAGKSRGIEKAWASRNPTGKTVTHDQI